jgi:glycosyltransferase involved in cell wall biosynthesis
VIFLAFRGHEILPFFRLLTRKPIIFDAFVSAYDTLCFDRKIFKPDSVLGKILKWYDAYLCRIADFVLVDTKTHSEYFANEFKAKNVSYLYLESNRDLFKPIETEKKKNKFIVFWYGKCWPLQGVEVILKAAEILKDDSKIVFRLVGPVRKKYKNLVATLNSKNIEFIDYVSYESLPSEIAKADLCLGGHFSDIPKAKRVIPGKAFQFIACGRKTILGDNPANRELFNEAENIYFVRMNSGEELATKILKIKEKEQAYKQNG